MQVYKEMAQGMSGNYTIGTVSQIPRGWYEKTRGLHKNCERGDAGLHKDGTRRDDAP